MAHTFRHWIILVSAILFFSVGNLLFAVPNHIMNGGMTGIGQLGYYLFHFNIGLSIFLLNVPLFVIAFFSFRPLFYNSVICMMISSLLIGILQDYLVPIGFHNIWLGSIGGGLWMGIALGLLGRLNASLGGGSLLGKLLHQQFGFSFSKSVFLIDASIYPLCWFLVGGKETYFSLLLTAASSFGIYVFGRTMDGRENRKNAQPSPAGSING